MRLLNIVGARPNFMKVAPIHEAALKAGIDARLLHTGQHYDAQMSDVFFKQLGMPKPDIHLHVGSASHAVQTANIMKDFESVVLKEKPDAILVAGDVNSTVACALVASKMHIPVVHLEAGLRSFDRQMPEETNRLVTDVLSDLLLTPSKDADENLLKEGVAHHKIVRVGNAMIDTLLAHRNTALKAVDLDQWGIRAGQYAAMTLHRPSNVDNPETLKSLLQAIASIAQNIPVVFAAHPRTAKNIGSFGFESMTQSLVTTQPLGYLEFLALQAQAKFVLTDSGGIQEETTALGIPCLTLRENTERPITITEGTNTLVGTNPTKITKEANEILNSGGKTGRIPALWDGKTASRCIDAILKLGEIQPTKLRQAS